MLRPRVPIPVISPPPCRRSQLQPRYRRHSERRAAHSETDAAVAAKADAARAAGLVPIICIGETAAQRAAGETLAVVAGQLAGSLPADIQPAQCVVAYEPVWAIGSGATPTRTRSPWCTIVCGSGWWNGSVRRRGDSAALRRIGEAGQCRRDRADRPCRRAAGRRCEPCGRRFWAICVACA